MHFTFTFLAATFRFVYSNDMHKIVRLTVWIRELAENMVTL